MRTAGVGFAVSNWIAAQGISPTPISDRLMSMRIQLKGGDNLTLICVYAPTMQRPQEENSSMKCSVAMYQLPKWTALSF